MKKVLGFVASVMSIAMLSCGDGNNEESKTAEQPKVTKESIAGDIATLEAKAESHTQLDYSTANSLIAAYADYAKNFPDDPQTPEYLFKAGRIATTMRQSKQAIDFYKTVYTKYPDFNKAPDALFLQGFVYESQLNDTAKAKAVYSEVIEKYPKTRLAEDARASIDNMGKSPEELIKEFEKKDKESKPAL